MANLKKSFFQKIGPGLITAALVFGPGSLTVNTKLGASYGTTFLWVIVVAIVFMSSYTNLSSRIGCIANRSLMQIIANRFGRWVSVLLGIGIFFIGASFQAGNAIGAGVAFKEIFGLSQPFWIVLISALAIAVVYTRKFYKVLESLMASLVILMLICFLVTFIMSKPLLSKIIAGLVPRIPEGSELLLVALIASSFSIVGAFYQSYLVQAKGWTEKEIGTSYRDSVRGILLLGFLSAIVMLCASSILHSQNIEVNHAGDLGLALEPLFGKFTTNLFMVGLFAASFTSLLGNATIGGTLLGDAFGFGHHLNLPAVKRAVMMVIIFGSAIAILFGRLPLELIVFAQAITIVVAPAAAFFLLIVINDKSVMNNRVNSWLDNVIPIGGFLLLLFLALFHLRRLIFT